MPLLLRGNFMIKLGIIRCEDLAVAKLHDFLGQRRPIAITLYPEVAARDDEDRERLLESILLDFSIGNGSFKRTQAHRFDAFDTEVVRITCEKLGPPCLCRVHDMAVSDGRTSVDFFTQLQGIEGLRLSFLATDQAPDVMAVSNRRAPLVVILDPDSEVVLQVVRSPFVFNVQRRERATRYPLNRLVLAVLLRTEVRALLARLRERDSGLRMSRVRLLAPECLRLLEIEPRFRFERYDVLKPPTAEFDVVRAMNILNRSYFRDSELRLAVRNVHASLRVGGLFITGSNQDTGSPVDGAIYQRSERGFQSLWVSGTGSQVDAIVTATRTP
jgi:hypothetical protein